MYFNDGLEIHTVMLEYYVGISYGQSKSLMVCTDCVYEDNSCCVYVDLFISEVS